MGDDEGLEEERRQEFVDEVPFFSRAYHERSKEAKTAKMFGGGGGGGGGSKREQKLQMKKQMFDQRGSQYSTTWQTEMKSACFKSPAFCCIAIFCSPCVSYQNRVEALHNDMRFYTCCQGLLPCSGRMKEEKCPEFCLCLETCCCFPNSVLATRYLLQDEMQFRTPSATTASSAPWSPSKVWLASATLPPSLSQA